MPVRGRDCEVVGQAAGTESETANRAGLELLSIISRLTSFLKTLTWDHGSLKSFSQTDDLSNFISRTKPGGSAST